MISDSCRLLQNGRAGGDAQDMSERFGIPDHSPQHAPDHSLQNPTAQGNWHNIGGGGDEAWPTASTYGGGSGVPGATPYIPDTPHSTTLAVVLAMLFGPLGLFYVGFLHGLLALFLVIPVVRSITLSIVATLGADADSSRAWIALGVMWCITVPWAIAGVRWRNRRFNR
jgi:hypothetical protein